MLKSVSKYFCIALAFLVLFVFFPAPVFADDLDGEQVLLLTARTETTYPDGEVDVSYVEDASNNSYTALVRDRKTGEILESYTEKPDIPIDVLHSIRSEDSTDRAIHNYNTTLAHNVTLEKADGKSIQAYTWAEVNVTADFSWAQIERVNKCGHQSGSSGSYSLNAANTTVRTTSFPCNTILLEIHGTIEVRSSNGVGFTFKGLTDAGFSISGSSTTYWTARKNYGRQTSFSIM